MFRKKKKVETVLHNEDAYRKDLWILYYDWIYNVFSFTLNKYWFRVIDPESLNRSKSIQDMSDFIREILLMPDDNPKKNDFTIEESFNLLREKISYFDISEVNELNNADNSYSLDSFDYYSIWKFCRVSVYRDLLMIYTISKTKSVRIMRERDYFFELYFHKYIAKKVSYLLSS